MFIGEAPGFNEDLKGIPFCGKAGGILDELLSSVNLTRDEIYITNILKCRPPGNRDPKPEEIEQCTGYLDKQIELINPEVMCCLLPFPADQLPNYVRYSALIEYLVYPHIKLIV